MTPAEFIRKWGDSTLRESQGSQSHFNDLCDLLGVPRPTEEDTTGDQYCFERGAEKVGGGNGWADVWRKGCFGWEYKGKHKDLNTALRQLQAYALNLENPPYLVVSDMARIIVHTNWTNTVSRKYEFPLEALGDPANLEILRQVFEGSERLKPGVTPQDLTAKAAQRFGELGRRLQERKHEPRAVAHFLNRLVFCMFAEDAGLLPADLFSKMVKATRQKPAAALAQMTDLFGKMASPGDTFFGADLIRWFNGGLFEDDAALPLEPIDLELIWRTADEHDWSEIDPAIFGNLFEEALMATRERKALGAHYTDRDKIMKIVEPVIVRPLEAEWAGVLDEAVAAMALVKAADTERKAVFDAAGEEMKVDSSAAKAGEARRRKALNDIAKRRDAAFGLARDRVQAHLDRLAAYRVLDPACGSGNFLYVALHALLDLERRAIFDAERLGLPGFVARVGLEAVRGIEIDKYAAELARLTLWIGYLQWIRRNNANVTDPVLSTLDQIENRDALLNADGTEAEWPEVDAIIGNPPFVGDRKMIAALGETYVEQLRETYRGRVPGGADFVTYWVAKAWEQLAEEPRRFAGLVTTNSIRGGANRKVLEPIAEAGSIFEAWSDEPWVLDGASVRVSMVSFGNGYPSARLDGRVVAHIQPDLTSTSSNVAEIRCLSENGATAFIGTMKNGPFNVSGDLAREWLKEPTNPNGRSNADVLAPWTNGRDITGRSAGQWVIDFGPKAELAASALFAKPFDHVLKNVKPLRDGLRRKAYRELWWRYQEAQPKLRALITMLPRYLVSPRVAKYRLFRWVDSTTVPDSAVAVIARDDDTAFGILHSRFHELWSLRLGTWLGVGNDPRYTPSTTFETFPFPEGLTPNIPAADYAADPRAVAIAKAAAELNKLREAWLNPPDLIRVEPEVVAGYPDRVLPRDEAAAAILKTRTLTNLYNERPAWLDMAHRRLDEAVAAAYGWPADLTDEQVLEHLFALNQERAAAGR